MVTFRLFIVHVVTELDRGCIHEQLTTGHDLSEVTTAIMLACNTLEYLCTEVISNYCLNVCHKKVPGIYARALRNDTPNNVADAISNQQ